MHLKEEEKLAIVANCENGSYKSFGDLEVRRVENVDGYKYFFDNDEWAASISISNNSEIGILPPGLISNEEDLFEEIPEGEESEDFVKLEA